MKVEVRNNNVQRAMRILKTKLTEEGFFRELQERKFYEKPSEKRRRKRRAAISRARKDESIRKSNEV